MKELFNFFVSLGKYFYKLDEVGALLLLHEVLQEEPLTFLHHLLHEFV